MKTNFIRTLRNREMSSHFLGSRAQLATAIEISPSPRSEARREGRGEISPNEFAHCVPKRGAGTARPRALRFDGFAIWGRAVPTPVHGEGIWSRGTAVLEQRLRSVSRGGDGSSPNDAIKFQRPGTSRPRPAFWDAMRENFREVPNPTLSSASQRKGSPVAVSNCAPGFRVSLLFLAS